MEGVIAKKEDAAGLFAKNVVNIRYKDIFTLYQRSRTGSVWDCSSNGEGN
jgi:hypothetical protein